MGERLALRVDFLEPVREGFLLLHVAGDRAHPLIAVVWIGGHYEIAEQAENTLLLQLVDVES